jgi:hypothetical protein
VPGPSGAATLPVQRIPVRAYGGRDPAAGNIVWKVGEAGFQILQQRARRSGRCDFLSTGYEDRLGLRINLFGRQPAAEKH